MLWHSSKRKGEEKSRRKENKLFVARICATSLSLKSLKTKSLALGILDRLRELMVFTIPGQKAEGLNNKAKAISHRCYGFRTAGTLILALYRCLGKLPELQIVRRFLRGTKQIKPIVETLDHGYSARRRS